jgi:lipocalin
MPALDKDIFAELVAQAKSYGFDTESLILVDQAQK